MCKKFFTTIFCGLGLVAFSFSNSYSMEKKEEVKKEEKKEVQREGVSVAERAYYKEHPWDFVEKKFVEEPYQLDAKPTSNLHKKELKIYSSISSICWILSFMMSKIGGLGTKDTCGVMFAVSVPVLFGIAVFHWYFDAYHKNILYLDKEIDILISILKDFDSKLDNDSKELLPEDLHKTFASLRTVYDKEGRDGVKREWGKVHQHIKDKLMYDVKKSKYVKPVINNYNYNTNYNSTN